MSSGAEEGRVSVNVERLAALEAVAEAATHATDGRTEATLTAGDIRAWAAHQGAGAVRNWMLGIAAALAALEGE